MVESGRGRFDGREPGKKRRDFAGREAQKNAGGLVDGRRNALTGESNLRN